MSKIFTSIILLFSMVSIVSCSNNEEGTSEMSKPLAKSEHRFAPEEFDFIGSQHNQILSNLEQDLSTNNIEDDMIQEYSKSFIYNKTASIYTNEADLILANQAIHSGLHTIPNYTQSLYPNPAHQSIMSTNTKNYLDNLLDIMLEENAELDNIIENISNLENQAYNDLSLTNADLLIIFPATSVAKHSINYWTDNFYKWEDLLSVTNPSVMAKGKTPGRRIGEIALADVGGAAGMAAAAWAVNVWVGPGTMAYGASIIGGAVSCSVGAGVYHIAASIFRWD